VTSNTTLANLTSLLVIVMAFLTFATEFSDLQMWQNGGIYGKLGMVSKFVSWRMSDSVHPA
jgi:hypothetical protein